MFQYVMRIVSTKVVEDNWQHRLANSSRHVARIAGGSKVVSSKVIMIAHLTSTTIEAFLAKVATEGLIVLLNFNFKQASHWHMSIGHIPLVNIFG